MRSKVCYICSLRAAIFDISDIPICNVCAEEHLPEKTAVKEKKTSPAEVIPSLFDDTPVEELLIEWDQSQKTPRM